MVLKGNTEAQLLFLFSQRSTHCTIFLAKEVTIFRKSLLLEYVIFAFVVYLLLLFSKL